MANGEFCKYCGHQETDHERPEDWEDRSRRRQGYRKSLDACSGFVSKVKTREPTKKEWALQEALLDREAQRRFAFGQYASIVRQNNFSRELAKIDREGGEDVAERRKQFIEDAKRENHRHIHIG